MACIASIDVKADEPAVTALSKAFGCDLRFYPADALATVPGEFAESSFVQEQVGVGNVCERAALAAAGEKGALVLSKQAGEGVTVAVAVQPCGPYRF